MRLGPMTEQRKKKEVPLLLLDQVDDVVLHIVLFQWVAAGRCITCTWRALARSSSQQHHRGWEQVVWPSPRHAAAGTAIRQCLQTLQQGEKEEQKAIPRPALLVTTRRCNRGPPHSSPTMIRRRGPRPALLETIRRCKRRNNISPLFVYVATLPHDDSEGGSSPI